MPHQPEALARIRGPFVDLPVRLKACHVETYTARI